MFYVGATRWVALFFIILQIAGLFFLLNRGKNHCSITSTANAPLIKPDYLQFNLPYFQTTGQGIRRRSARKEAKSHLYRTATMHVYRREKKWGRK